MSAGPQPGNDAPASTGHSRRTPPRQATMKDIARRAGVSESAVSFALNDRPGVSEATRARVRRVAEQLGWRPNSAARALSGEGVGTVGLVLARRARSLGVDSFFLELISGVQQVLADHHLGLLFQVVEDIDAECAMYQRWWAERRVDGVLVVDPRSSDPRPELLDSLGLPAVVIGSLSEELAGKADAFGAMANLRTDDAAAMAQVIRHLYGLGHRRILHIAGLPDLAHTARRIRSLQQEALRLGLAETRSVVTDYSDTEGAAATRLAVQEGRPPTAIIYDSDVLAAAGVSVLAAHGLSVPDDVSVVAWEDSVLCRMVHPWLTALARDTVALGRSAAEQLTALIQGRPATVADPLLPELIVRESTAPPSRTAGGTPGSP
ncbi:LacI family DNA-binding transcriptional regulator [Streptomyces sp. NPDC001156]